MEALSDILQPYKDMIGLFAAVTTVLQFLSGALVCRDIHKKKSALGMSIVPFMGGVVFGILNLQYGYMLQDVTMVVVNVVGILLNIGYSSVFFNYTKKVQRQSTIKESLYGALFAALCLVYAWIEDPSVVEFRFGMLVTVILMLLIASPLFNLREIIKTQSTASLPFPIIASGAVVSFLWLLYGITLKNDFIVFQNVFGVSLCAIQLSLFVIYPTKEEPVRKRKSSKKTS